MADVSVLLNLSGKVVFERTDPLMDLVSGHGPLLFYDRLSLERFPLAPEEQEGHVQKLILDLKNLLESRRLSADDEGGRIRIIVTLDLVGGFSHQSGLRYSFPAQKARCILEKMKRAFQKDTQLFGRFGFSFLFIECDSTSAQANDFYRSLAHDGYHGLPTGWLTTEMMTVNAARDQMLARLDSPTEDLPLSHDSIHSAYVDFQHELEKHTTSVAALLEQAGVGEAFRKYIQGGCASLETIGDVGRFDYDELFRTAVSECIGLRCQELGHCSSFIFKLRTGTASQRKKDEMVLASLLQLLVTCTTPWPAALHVVDGKAHEHLLRVEELSRLKEAVKQCLLKLRSDGTLRWAEDKQFSYQEYSAKNTDPVETDSFDAVNDEASQQRTALYEQFCELRRVPFFFGRRPGDWQWYTSVMELLDKMMAFESENDRPLCDSQRRITDREMNREPREATYVELKVKRDKLLEEQRPVNPMEDLKSYLEERKTVMDELAALKEQLKKQMVKLGFALTTFWLSLFVCLVSVVCYAFHFFLPSVSDSPVWLLAGVGAASLVGVVAAFVAQSRVGASISAVFSQIDDRLDRLKKGQTAYVERVNNRIKTQNEADIRRKNLRELEEKLAQFDRHNVQVELWEKHFSGMESKLMTMLTYVGNNAAESGGPPIVVDDDGLNINDKPCLPTVVSEQFRSMQTTSSQGQKIEPVTCFLRRIDITSFN